MAALPLLAISVQQPNAARILHAGRAIDGQEWSTEIRGDVMLHAAADFARGFIDDWSDPLSEYMLRGGVVGIIEITGCVRLPPGKARRRRSTGTPWRILAPFRSSRAVGSLGFSGRIFTRRKHIARLNPLGRR